MISQTLIKKVTRLAQAEINKYGIPSPVHFSLARSKGKELARILNQREDLVELGTILMDIKIGEAFSLNKLDQHVAMSLAYAQELLGPSQELSAEEKEVVYNAVTSHHGAIPHTSLESEIVTNSDCYRFIHPMGVIEYIRILSARPNIQLSSIIAQAGAKLNEKWSLVTLPLVKKELEPHYLSFQELFTRATKDF